MPGVHQLSGRRDEIEFPEDPEHLSVRELVHNPISVANTQVYLGIGTSHLIRNPSFLEVSEPGPGLEDTLGSGEKSSTNF